MFERINYKIEAELALTEQVCSYIHLQYYLYIKLCNFISPKCFLQPNGTCFTG